LLALSNKRLIFVVKGRGEKSMLYDGLEKTDGKQARDELY